MSVWMSAGEFWTNAVEERDKLQKKKAVLSQGNRAMLQLFFSV